ncbi:hypothetical protein FXW07_02045 [Methanosarcina sp. DH1]|nr:hypothetical protein [Methanosarcina sp. DH1]
MCCTSANSTNVVTSIGNREMIFIPDKNLETFVPFIELMPLKYRKPHIIKNLILFL